MRSVRTAVPSVAGRHLLRTMFPAAAPIVSVGLGNFPAEPAQNPPSSSLGSAIASAADGAHSLHRPHYAAPRGSRRLSRPAVGTEA